MSLKVGNLTPETTALATGVHCNKDLSPSFESCSYPKSRNGSLISPNPVSSLKKLKSNCKSGLFNLAPFKDAGIRAAGNVT